SLLTWETDSFAYADSWDEVKGRYVGLRVREQIAIGQLRGLVVKPEVARRQLQREAEPSDTLGEEEPGYKPAPEQPGTEPTAQRRRFFGVKSLDPQRVSRDADQVATEVVQHLV